MQNVSPGTENEGAGRNVAKGNIHVTGSGIVNVEHNNSTPQHFFNVGCEKPSETGQRGNPSPNGGAAS